MNRLPSDIEVAVLGAGVSGLTTAICLAEAGMRVRIYTAEPPHQTTSAAAGAMWGPYLVEPVDKVAVWSRRTLEEFRHLTGDPRTGVRFVAGIEASRIPAAVPAWAGQLDGFRLCERSELPDGFATGWRYAAPLVDMPVYLTYLLERLVAAGGSLLAMTVERLRDTAELAPIVVNCTGIGARGLVPDHELTPVRGQLVIVANPGISEFFSEDTGSSPDLLHIYPHGDTVVLGGLAAPGSWDMQPDPAIAQAILNRCTGIDPRLRDAEVIGHRVGLRPTRRAVRVDRQRLGTTTLIHNYGHGGAGVTLSWGCAYEVSTLVLGHTNM